MQGWFVARTKYNREAWAAENVVRQLAVPYLPKYAELAKVGGHYEVRPKLLFPSYIFVHAYDGRWRFLIGTYGIASVIMVGKAPAVISTQEIAKLKALEDTDGLIQLPKALKGGYKEGDKVRVTSGPYTNYEGLHAGCGTKDRERILLDYLGRKTAVLIDPTALVRV